MPTHKKWYTRRRYWTLALLAVLAYFCLIPSPLRVSPETTGYTTPLLPNGDVDYFGAYEQTYIHKLSPPEDNGQRLLIAACGPRVLEQSALANTFSWEELPTNERSKNWFEEQWIPLCEHMYIDPYAKPKFLDSLNWHEFMQRLWKTNHKEGEPHSPEEEWEQQYNTLWNKLVAAPWTAEEQPDTARWLEERSPVLDLFGVAVRKPNFVSWRQRPESGLWYMILLPDVQAQRMFGRDLKIRITERLGRGDIDGAWYDVMSMFYLSRKHYVHDPLLVVNLVGLAIEMMGWESAQVILQHGNPTPEQLERFAKDLASLPRVMTLYSDTELYGPYLGVQTLHRNRKALESLLAENGRSPGKKITNLESFFLYLFGGLGDTLTGDFLPRYITLLPFDRNIAGKRITEFLQTEQRISGDTAWTVNTITAKKHLENIEKGSIEKGWQLNSRWNLLRVPLIHTRSELIADYMISQLHPAIRAVQRALDRANTQFDMLRIAVALERYKSAEGSYPSDLESLVPRFLEEVPLDPFTGRKTLVYKLSPDSETAVLLHSSAWDESPTSNYKGLYLRIAAEK